MTKLETHVRETAEAIGFSVDAQNGGLLLFGERDGYTMILSPIGSSNGFTLSLSVSQDGGLPRASVLQQAKKQLPGLFSTCTVSAFRVSYTIRSAAKRDTVIERVKQAVDALPTFLRDSGMENCCRHCGAVGHTDAYCILGATDLLCEPCFSQISESADRSQQAYLQKNENVVAGSVGALLGSLIGAVAIILLSRLGFVAAISGVIMAVCAVKGYELLGGKFSVTGAIICGVLIVGMTYLADRIDWAIEVYQAFHPDDPEITFFMCFRAVHAVIRDAELVGRYAGNLALLYLFTLLGGVPTIIASLRKKTMQGSTHPLAASDPNPPAQL